MGCPLRSIPPQVTQTRARLGQTALLLLLLSLSLSLSLSLLLLLLF